MNVEPKKKKKKFNSKKFLKNNEKSDIDAAA